MNKTIQIILAVLIGCACGVSYADDAPLEELTLKQAYQLALERSETVAISKEEIRAAQGRFSQSLSTALPKVSFESSDTWQDVPQGSSERRYTPQRQFVFTQPLFSGFKEFAAIAASGAEGKQRKFEVVRAKHLLFTDVADAFYFLKSFQEELKTQEEVNAALKERITELERRQTLGRSKVSEVASTEARVYQNEADTEAVRSQQDVARELLEFLVGTSIASLAGEDVIVEGLPPVDEYIAKADSRPDVQAQAQALKVAQSQVTIARSGYFPTVTAVGDYYTKRVGSSSDIDWDVTLNVSVPLFTSGLTTGQVKEAKAIAEQVRLRLSQVKREAVLNIRNSYTQLASDLKQTLAYKKAVDAVQKSYDLQEKDYTNSLVSNLDVLQSLEDLQTTQRNYISIKNETQRAYWALKVAIGDIFDDTF